MSLAMACSLILSPHLLAINILSGPSFTSTTNAPLAGLLQFTSDVPSRVSVFISNGTTVREQDFYNFATSNSVPLYGFQPNQTNLIQVTAFDQYGNAFTSPQLLKFVTAPLPSDFPEITLLKGVPSQMEPGYTLFTVQNRANNNGYIVIVDASGNVVWYRRVLQSTDIDVQQLADGNLFIHEQSPAGRFVELNLLGQIVQTWAPAAGYPINSHAAVLTSRGTILYISDVSENVPNFPTLLPTQSTTTNPPLATVKIDDNPIVEVSTNGTLVNAWSPINQIDPTRVTYLTGDFPSPYGMDCEHANAVVDDTNDDSIIVSLRDENAIYKFSRATGNLIWILAPHDSGVAPDAAWPTSFQKYLLTPVGSSFGWSYGQHAPMLTPQGTLIDFDDGPDRASPFEPILADQNNYSRAVEYNINQTNMTISQVWDSYDQGNAPGDRIYSYIMGNADWLPQQRNVLTTYAWVNYTNGVSVDANGATMARIVEYTHDPVPQVVFDLALWNYDATEPANGGFYVYRSHRIPDLYGHPAEPVGNMIISQLNHGALTPQDHTPYLEFAADPTFTYEIQASSDLKTWTTIGFAVQEDEFGDFGFSDLTAAQYSTRFYRVVTVTQ